MFEVKGDAVRPGALAGCIFAPCAPVLNFAPDVIPSLSKLTHCSAGSKIKATSLAFALLARGKERDFAKRTRFREMIESKTPYR